MSKQKFDRVERWAIWKVGECKCDICNEIIDLIDVHIDHIIPETAPKLSDWQNIQRIHNFNETNLTQEENLRALCGPCNIRKSNDTRRSELLHDILRRAQKRASDIRKLVMATRKKISVTTWRTLVAEAIRQGYRSDIDLAMSASKLLALNSLWVNRFTARLDLSKYLGEEADKLMKLSVLKVGEEVAVRDRDGEIVQVFTLEHVEELGDNPDFVRGNLDDRISWSLLQYLIELKRFLALYQFPERSHFDSLGLSIFDIRYLPAYALGIVDLSMGSSETIFDIVTEGKARIVDLSSSSLSVAFKGIIYTIAELMRGDFDNDGGEEILVELRRDLDGQPFLDLQLLRFRAGASYFEPLSFDGLEMERIERERPITVSELP